MGRSISAPPGYDEDPNYVYQLRRPLYGMPSAARAWHHTISAYLKSQGCKLVGFDRSMWTVVKEGHVILITVHIDDFIILVRTNIRNFTDSNIAKNTIFAIGAYSIFEKQFLWMFDF
jgi:hypothetical protein